MLEVYTQVSYVILYGRNDRFLRLNTVWQIDTGGKAPHFITATPERKK